MKTLSRRWIYTAIAALIGLIVIFAIFLSLKPEVVEAPREYTVYRGDLEISNLATGEVRPENRLEIKPPLEGRIDEVLVNEGQEVQAGQVLAWMSSNERAALLDAARAKGEAEVRHWEELYRPIPVVAPLSGTIIYRNVEAGQTFGTNTVIIAMSDHLIVKAQVDETDLALIRLNQQARVTLDAYPAEPLMGRVHKISFESKMVNNVTTYSIDVQTNKVPEFMRSGMTTTIAFISDVRRGVLLVPTESIHKINGKNYVVMKSKDRDSDREIGIGLSDGKFTEVTSGLLEGDIVLAPRLPNASGGSEAP